MPLISLPGKKAMQQLRRNAVARWPDGRRDGRRLEGIVLPETVPGFRLRGGDMVFTIGSCFARNMETRLRELGFVVPALDVSLPEEERGSDVVNDILNKYNPQSIVNELIWAFEQPFPDEAYLRVGQQEWHDPHLAGNTKAVPLPRLRGRRAMVTRLFKRLPRCRYVIVTLGLVEAWYDTTLNLYLNTAPPAAAIAREPQRFRFDVLGHDEVVAELERMWELIRKHGNRRVRMLITVSPVPLRATYTDQDVLVANMYSKSVLRAAIGTFTARYNEVDYFPSFEAAMLTNRSTAFMEDNRHVAPELVNAIIDRVVARYVRAEDGAAAEPEEPAADSKLPMVSQIRAHLKMGRATTARKLMAAIDKAGTFQAAGYDEFDFRYLYARTLTETGAVLEAEPQLARCVQLQPESALAHYAMARTLARLQRPLRAEEAFRRTVEIDPSNVDALVRLARMQVRNGKLPDAEQTGIAAQALAVDNVDVAELLADIRAAAASEWGTDDGAVAISPSAPRSLLRRVAELLKSPEKRKRPDAPA